MRACVRAHPPIHPPTQIGHEALALPEPDGDALKIVVGYLLCFFGTTVFRFSPEGIYSD